MNFYQSYTDKSLIMRLIADALYCKRKIMKMQTLIEPELVEIPRRKLNKAPQTGSSNSVTNSNTIQIQFQTKSLASLEST